MDNKTISFDLSFNFTQRIKILFGKKLNTSFTVKDDEFKIYVNGEIMFTNTKNNL